MQDLSIFIMSYEIYHVHVHLNCIIYMCRYNIVVDVNGVKHTCRFLLGQRWRSKLFWRRSLSICCVKVGLSFYRNQTYSVDTYPFFCLWCYDARWKQMYVICWFNAMLNGNVIHVMLLFLCWNFCFDKWVEKMGWIGGLNFYLGYVYSAEFG